MASTITNYTINVDTQFPVPGADNDTNGFRTNFSNLRDGLVAASTEITDIMLVQDGIITQLNSITTPESIVTTNLLASQITATNLTANGNIVTKGSFVGDGSQLTGISIANWTTPFTSLDVTGRLNASTIKVAGQLTATNVSVSGTVAAGFFQGDGSQLTGIQVTTTNLSSLVTLNLPNTTVSAKALNVAGNATAQFFIGDGSQLTNLKYPAQDTLSKLTVSGDTLLAGNITSYGTFTTSSTIFAKSISLSDTLTVTTATAGYFVGDGSGLRNVQLANVYGSTALTDVKTKSVTLVNNVNGTTTASIYLTTSTLIVSDVTKILVLSTATTNATLAAYSGAGTNLYISTLTFSTVLTGISPASTDYNTFKLWPGDPVFHPVLAVDLANKTVTTTPFDDTLAIAAGVGAGTVIKFYKTNSPSVALYATAAPSSIKGAAGDKKGMMFAENPPGNTKYFYVCTADYTDGTADIWAKIQQIAF